MGVGKGNSIFSGLATSDRGKGKFRPSPENHVRGAPSGHDTEQRQSASGISEADAGLADRPGLASLAAPFNFAVWTAPKRAPAWVCWRRFANMPAP